MLKVRAVVLNRVVKAGLTEKVAFEQSLKQERTLAVLISEGSAFWTHVRHGPCKRSIHQEFHTPVVETGNCNTSAKTWIWMNNRQFKYAKNMCLNQEIYNYISYSSVSYYLFLLPREISVNILSAKCYTQNSPQRVSVRLNFEQKPECRLC